MSFAKVDEDTAAQRLDFHVHLVGNGLAGSGCWIRMRGWHRMMGAMMSRTLGMPVGITDSTFDAVYLKRLVNHVRESSMGQALLLAQDEVYFENGGKMDFGSFHVPNDYVFQVCEDHPEFLPAVSIHPSRPDALTELARCLTRGARALKLLPNCHGVNCSLRIHDPFWEKVAEAGLPFLAHTGGEMTVPVVSRLYESPAILRRPLEIGVTVIAAHAASRSGLWDTDYFDLLIEMMAEFPNLYADTSALNTPFRSAVIARILKSPYLDRFIHGSDFPVPVGTWYARARRLIDEDSRRKAAACENLIERDYLLKIPMGFDESHFTRGRKLLRILE